jgi:hypothetical protein
MQCSQFLINWILKNKTLIRKREYYTDDCLANKLVPYIRNLPKNTRIFWPDLAGAHYSKKPSNY